MGEKAKPYIKLRRAWIGGARRKLKIKPLRDSYSYFEDRSPGFDTATIHLVTPACALYRIGEDAIAITDGGEGYMPFSISELQQMLKEAKKLPLVTSFHTDRLKAA